MIYKSPCHVPSLNEHNLTACIPTRRFRGPAWFAPPTNSDVAYIDTLVIREGAIGSALGPIGEDAGGRHKGELIYDQICRAFSSCAAFALCLCWLWYSFSRIVKEVMVCATYMIRTSDASTAISKGIFISDWLGACSCRSALKYSNRREWNPNQG